MFGPPPIPKPRPPLPPGPYLVLGLARSGQAAARLLVERGGQVTGCDSGRPPGAEGLRGLGVEVNLDASGVDPVDAVETLVKSPGVPADAPAVAAARRAGVAVIGELELAWRLIPNPVIAVTGTNGKTTTAEMIGHIYRAADRPVEVAGNVGTALSELPDRLDPDAVVVCEASSFQLEDAVEFAPECAAFLNFGPDHLDRHRNMTEYLGAKHAVFAHQQSSDVAVLNGEDPAMPDRVAARTVRFCPSREAAGCDLGRAGGRISVGGQPLLDVAELQVIGDHNLANAMAAAAACLSMGLECEPIADGLASFTGVAHRLESIRELDGVLFVNDSKATNVSAAATALGSFDRPVRAILGGSSKGEDFSPLAGPVAQSCSACYLIGEAAEEVRHGLAEASEQGIGIRICDDLAEAVGRAAGEARPGEVVLLSPGCASFDDFADYTERGETFRRLVEGLT